MKDEDNELGSLLRAWRDRLSPQDAGISAHGRRRAQGLRREELAGVAALSVDYLVRLEQGRSRRPSQQVVVSLARALQLDVHETAALHRAAGLPVPSAGVISHHLPPGVHRLIHRMADTPVAVFSAQWDLVTWNPLWAALVGDPNTRKATDRNLVRATFCATRAWNAVTSMPGTDAAGDIAFERALVADLRTALGMYPGDQGLRSLISEVSQSSDLFRRLWESGAVGRHESARKQVEHPVVGRLELDCDVLTAGGSDLRIVIYTVSAGSRDAERLDFLKVGEVQALTES